MEWSRLTQEEAAGIDSLETYKEVFEINPKQKVIPVSGFSETDRLREAVFPPECIEDLRHWVARMLRTPIGSISTPRWESTRFQ